MISDKPKQNETQQYIAKYSSGFLKIGIIGALASLIFWLAYDFAYAANMIPYEVYLMIRPIFYFLPIIIGIGILGFFQKHASNLAFPALFVFLFPTVVDTLYIIIDYEIRLLFYVGLMIAVAIMMLTLHEQVRNRIILVIFVIAMVANGFVPYLLRLLLFPTSPDWGVFLEVLAWISPYLIVNSIYFILTILLFVLELRNGPSYQKSSW